MLVPRDRDGPWTYGTVRVIGDVLRVVHVDGDCRKANHQRKSGDREGDPAIRACCEEHAGDERRNGDEEHLAGTESYPRRVDVQANEVEEQQRYERQSDGTRRNSFRLKAEATGLVSAEATRFVWAEAMRLVWAEATRFVSAEATQFVSGPSGIDW